MAPREPAPDEPASGSGVSGPFIRRPVTTFMMMAGLFIIGVAAYLRLPIASLPTVNVATMLVTAALSGADPQTEAFAVTNPLETQFGQIPGLTTMTSSSANSYAEITLSFGFNRTVDAAAQDVQAAINAAAAYLPAQLAQLAQPPSYRKTNPADTPVLILALTSDTLPLTTVSDYAQNILMQRISQMNGVGLITVGGEQQPAMRLEMDPVRLANIGLTIGDVRGAVANATTITAKGVLQGPRKAIALQANDQLMERQAYDDVVIAYRDGAPVLVRDMGHAEIGPANDLLAGWFNGKRAVILNVLLGNGANAIATVDKIKAELPRLKAAIPRAVSLDVVSDRTTTIRASVADVERTLLITIGLVVLTIFVFLRSLWATLIPSVTVPLALLGAFALMWVAGYTLDNLSLMALTISVGFVVDDAIVMLENITRYIEGGMKPHEAALKGSGEIGFTILSISISLVAVLIPLLLMSGIIGRLFREFAITLSMTILVSGFVSLTLTPVMASRFLKSHENERHGRLYQFSERMFDGLLRGYERGLDVVLKFRFITLMAFLGTVALTVYLFVIIPKGFFPQQDTGLITGISQGAQDISVKDMMRHQEELGAIVQKDPAVAHVAMAIGGTGNPSNTGRVFITLKPRDERDASADQVIARLGPQLDKVEGARLYLQATQDVTVGGRSSRTQYQYTLQDSDFDELNAWAPKLLAKLRTLPEIKDVASDQETDGSTLTLTIDRNAASRYGITAQTIDDTLDDAFGQREITQYFTQLASYEVILEVLPELQDDLTSLDKIFLKSSQGGEVPLASVAKWTTTPIQPLSISHQSQFPATTISFNLAPGASLSQATSAIERAQADLKAPPTLIATFQGNAQAFQDSLSSVPLLIVAALFVVYLILGVLYESYIHPLTILSTLPSAGVGALLMLMLFGYDFSLIALIGVILLIGIVKKNGIMLVDFAMTAEREQNLSSHDAIRQAALLRFRPILMTTFAAILGGVPLMLGHGTGSEIRQPLGYSMVGGLIVSQALTLFTTPVIYLYLDQVQHWLSGGKRRPPATAKASAPAAQSQAAPV